MKNFKNRLNFCTIALLLSLAVNFVLCGNANASPSKKKSHSAPPSNAYSFTPKEDKALVKAASQATSWVEVASCVGRNPRECQIRAGELRISTAHITKH